MWIFALCVCSFLAFSLSLAHSFCRSHTACSKHFVHTCELRAMQLISLTITSTCYLYTCLQLVSISLSSHFNFSNCIFSPSLHLCLSASATESVWHSNDIFIVFTAFRLNGLIKTFSCILTARQFIDSRRLKMFLPSMRIDDFSLFPYLELYFRRYESEDLRILIKFAILRSCSRKFNPNTEAQWKSIKVLFIKCYYHTFNWFFHKQIKLHPAIDPCSSQLTHGLWSRDTMWPRLICTWKLIWLSFCIQFSYESCMVVSTGSIVCL